MGWRAQWQHNCSGALGKLALVVGVAALLYVRGRQKGRRPPGQAATPD